MRKTVAATIVCSVLLYILLYSFALAPGVRQADAATQYVNSTAIVLLNVTNFVPRVVGVLLDDSTASPANEIDLTTGTFRRVYCNGTVIDYNGKNDIVACNATIFFTGNKSSQQNDNNEHYSNNSCTKTKESTYNITYSCSFRVWYYANNGTWHCNMSAWDNRTTSFTGIAGYNSSTDTAMINPLYALRVPPTINYGELAVNQTSPADIIQNVTNLGNMNIDLKLHGYGGNVNQENNLSMKCKVGNISAANERFSTTAAQAYASMTSISGQFANPNDLTGFNLEQRKSETTNSTKNTYWKIRTPLGVKGMCNGTIVFTSTIDD